MADILCIIDGMNDDRFNPDNYPALASFPERSFVKTVPDGQNPETLPCVLTLLGIAPPRNIRGWIEALGADVAVDADDLIFRGSWIRLDERGAYAGFDDAPEDIAAERHTGSDRVSAGTAAPIRARCISLGGYRSLFILPKHSAYADAIQMKPPYELFGVCPAELAGTGVELLDSALSAINKSHQGHALALWNPSSVKKLPVFPRRAAVVSGTNVVKGIAKALGMRLVTAKAMTGDTDTDLRMKVTETLKLAEEYPFVMLHIGGCDEAAHRQNRCEKDSFLKRVDETVIQALLLSGHDIAVSSDHGCDPSNGKHTGETQPYFKRPEKTGKTENEIK